MAKLNQQTDLNSIHETALHQADWTGLNSEAVTVTELQGYGFVVLRLRTAISGVTEAVKQLGIELPAAQAFTGSTDTRLVKWISPDEFLVTMPLPEKDAFVKQAQDAFQGIFSAVVDNSGAYSLLEISGPDYQDLLSKVTFYDTRHNLPSGKVVSTLMTKSPVIFYRLNDESVRCMVRWSFADYALKVLQNACEEYNQHNSFQ